MRHEITKARTRDEVRMKLFATTCTALARGLTADLAKSPMSAVPLIRMFKQTYGETPYQRLARCASAGATIAATSDTPITQIALDCGFTIDALAAAFRRRVGLSPRAYRQRSRADLGCAKRNGNLAILMAIMKSGAVAPQ